MRHGSLFSGIGGFDLAAQMAGFQNVFQVEIDPFCQKVLEKNFPDVKRYRDIKEFNGKEYEGAVDIVSGGFPCQPFSCAGKRKGKSDNRFLWPEMLRVLSEIRPTWIVGENVGGIINMAQQNSEPDMEGETDNSQKGSEETEANGILMGIITDLEGIGYDVQTFIIPACAVGAPHRRDRVWIVAHTKNNINRRIIRDSHAADTGCVRQEEYEVKTAGVEQCDAMLPTPATRDYKGANGQEHMSKDRPHMDQLPNALAHGTNTGTPLRLQPALVEWMMGFPNNFTNLKLPTE